MNRLHSEPTRRLRAPLSMSLLTLGILLGLLSGCGGAGEGSESGGEGAEATTGGETTDPSGTGGETTLAETLELPTTTLIPVPASGVPRHQLSAPLRDVWRQVEDAAAMIPPEYLGERTIEGINAWVAGEFMAWAEARGAASRNATEVAATLTAGSAEAGVAGALIGYTYEEFVIMFRGAPVPDEIAADPELLQTYLDSLTQASEPLAQQAAAASGACARTLAPLGPESPWVEWAQYCLDRAADVNEVYRLEE